MTRDELATVGRALFGERWQSTLARALDVNDRTVRRWLAGSAPIPAAVATEIAQIVARKREELEELAALFAAAAPEAP